MVKKTFNFNKATINYKKALDRVAMNLFKKPYNKLILSQKQKALKRFGARY